MSTTKVIGIDLGTSNSCLAVMEGSSPKVIPNEEGARTTPSVVAYTKTDRLVGAPAKRQAVTNPKNTIFSAKRFIGMPFSEVENEAMTVPFDVEASKEGMCLISSSDGSHAPEVVSSEVLSKLKRSAEAYLGCDVTEAVITVPAYFNDSQRQATRTAAKIAGLEVRRMINEPTAAALAYGLDKTGDKTVLVYDLGGGTFDVSLLEIGDGVIEVLSTSGDTHLGGDDFDHVLVDWLIESFKAKEGVDVSQDSMVGQRLREAAEKAKIELSSTQQTTINLPFLTADATGPKHMDITFTRSEFEKLTGHLVEKTMSPIRTALKDAKLSVDTVDEILLVGGSTRIPLVRNTVKDFFGKEPSSSVNPDEVVALGAAVQGGVFTGEVQDILLLDVTPLSLGIETMGGVMTRLIERNTTIPCNKKQVFTTAADNQSSVDITVLQGERPMSQDNKLLGKFTLSGIPPSPRGIPQIEVSFDIDANGIVSVIAEDKARKVKQNITIAGTGNMSEEEISQCIKNAEQNAKADEERKGDIEALNDLDSTVFGVKKLLADSTTTLTADQRVALESLLSEASNLLSSGSREDRVQMTGKLNETLHEITSQMYKESPSGESTSDDPPRQDDDIIDVDFEES